MNEFLEGKRRGLFTAVCAMFCLTSSLSPSVAADKPNILLIVADDAIWLGIQK
jgi:hypothetical protein